MTHADESTRCEFSRHSKWAGDNPGHILNLLLLLEEILRRVRTLCVPLESCLIHPSRPYSNVVISYAATIRLFWTVLRNCLSSNNNKFCSCVGKKFIVLYIHQGYGLYAQKGHPILRSKANVYVLKDTKAHTWLRIP